MKKTRWGPVTTYKWIEVITPINDLLNGFHWGYNYPFFRGVTVTLLIKMIFQLIGRFFLGAKIFLKTKKTNLCPLPVTQYPLVTQREAGLSQNVPLHAKPSPSNSEYLTGKWSFFPTDRVISTQPMWWFGLFKNKKKKNNGCIEWTKITQTSFGSLFFGMLDLLVWWLKQTKCFTENGGWVENADESHGRIRIRKDYHLKEKQTKRHTMNPED